jgi:LEA14-like dessication related protein
MKYISSLFIITAVLFMGIQGNSKIFKKPSANIEKFDIDSISFRDISLLFDVAISNPYPVGISLNNVTFKFSIEGNKLFETTTPRGFKIKANGKENTQFIVNIEYSKIEKIVRDYMKKDYLKCEVEGALVLKIPNTGIPGVPESVSFPFNLKTMIPAVKPEISIKNFKIKAPDVSAVTSAIKKSGKYLNTDIISGKDIKESAFKPSDIDLKLDVNFDIEVKNKTAAKILFNNLSYDFFMNSENMFKGNTNESKMSGNVLILKIVNQLSSKAMGKGITKVFKDKKGSFNIKGQTSIKLPESIRKEPLKLQFDEKGNFSL